MSVVSSMMRTSARSALVGGTRSVRVIASACALVATLLTVITIVFLPAIALVVGLNGGLAAAWFAYGVWMCGRTVMLVWRERGDQWAVVGASR